MVVTPPASASDRKIRIDPFMREFRLATQGGAMLLTRRGNFGPKMRTPDGCMFQESIRPV